MELTGPTKPRREVLVKGLSLMGSPDEITGTVCKMTAQLKHTFIDEVQKLFIAFIEYTSINTVFKEMKSTFVPPDQFQK